MNLHRLLLTNNACYITNRKMTVKGIMVHSTGCNNPWLKRYVGPNDGLLGENKYNNHWNTYHPGGREVCVHAFIGKLKDGSVATYQTLPWDICGWHSGKGSKGNANFMGYIGFEICEDGLTDSAYFNKVYKEAVDLCVYLCKQYNLDPTADGIIIGHYEGAERGIACNHGDPKNWFPKHGKSMDIFRAEVKRLVDAEKKSETNVEKPAETKTDEQTVWDFLFGKIGNAYGTAGMMGNLYAESGLRPNNLQNTYEKSLGLTDAEYTAKVDDGSYTNFIHDSAGYGLAQWTYWSRKEKLFNFVKTAGKSVGDLETQLNFLWQELTGYTSLLNTLKTAKAVTEASTAVLTIYERPADQGEAVQKKRAGFGQAYFDKYCGKTATVEDTASTAEIHVGDLVKITGSNYYGGKAIPGWVKNRKWVVYSVKGDRVVINKDEAGKSAIMSPVNADDLEVVKAVKVTEDTVEIYTVKDGDTLWSIAKTRLGSGSRYTEIKTLNGLTSDAICAGMKLKLPNK